MRHVRGGDPGSGQDPHDEDTNLHKRLSSAIQDRFIKHFDTQVSSRDGNQDLSMWMLDVEEVVREIMGDTWLLHALLVASTSCLKQQWMRAYP